MADALSWRQEDEKKRLGPSSRFEHAPNAWCTTHHTEEKRRPNSAAVREQSGSRDWISYCSTGKEPLILSFCKPIGVCARVSKHQQGGRFVSPGLVGVQPKPAAACRQIPAQQQHSKPTEDAPPSPHGARQSSLSALPRCRNTGAPGKSLRTLAHALQLEISTDCYRGGHPLRSRLRVSPRFQAKQAPSDTRCSRCSPQNAKLVTGVGSLCCWDTLAPGIFFGEVVVAAL